MDCYPTSRMSLRLAAAGSVASRGAAEKQNLAMLSTSFTRPKGAELEEPMEGEVDLSL